MIVQEDAKAARKLEAYHTGTPRAAARVITAEQRRLELAALMMVGLGAFGLIARFQIMLMGLARPSAGNIFFRLYAMHELPFLLLLVLTGVVTAAVAARAKRAPAADDITMLDRLGSPSPAQVWILSLGVVIATLAVTHLVLHALPFSMDEFSADFQARLFAGGKFRSELPTLWRPFAGVMTPIFVSYSAATGRWLSVYLPVYAFFKAPFVAIGAGTLLNPLLAGASIMVLAAITRRLWPGEGLRPWVALALLAASSQFVLTSGSAYSMPAHLLLNLTWLWLYLRGDARSWAVALILGVLALGLHNPFPHALFVAPFLVRLLRERRWSRLGSAVSAYGVGSVVWLGWLQLSYSRAQQGGGLLSVFAFPNLSSLWLHGINLTLLFTWQVPALGLLVIVALCRPRRLGPVLSDLALGAVLTLGFFLFFPSTQGHGWGYRYVYQVLGSLVLIAAAGVPQVSEALGARRAQRLLLASLAVALVVQLPIRLAQTERFVRPFAAGVHYLTTRDADVVLVSGDSIWYGSDLLRNDPFLHGQPVIVYSTRLTAAGRELLQREHPGRVIVVPDSDLLRLGMTPRAVHRW